MAQKKKNPAVTKGKKKKSRNKSEMMNSIIETTMILIAQKGYKNVSTNHIAEALKISIGTLYHHFPEGKPDIIKELEKRIKIQYFPDALANFHDFDNLDLFLEKFFTRFLEVHKNNRTLILASMEAFNFKSELIENSIEYEIKNDENIIHFFAQFSVLKHKDIGRLTVAIKQSITIIDILVHQYLMDNTIFESDFAFVIFLRDFTLWQLNRN